MAEAPNLILNNDVKMPSLGFGTWQLKGDSCLESTQTALKTGYRLIDTAKIYINESEVGQAIKASGIAREEIFITTKLWPGDFYEARENFEASIERLSLDYVDLYLLHWPGRDETLRQKAWAELAEIYKEGLAKCVGVSNFSPKQLEDLSETSEIMPAVNQIEFHPFVFSEQKETLTYCKQQGIVVQGYSPLAQGNLINAVEISEIANNLGKTNAQIMIRWALDNGTVPLPRSSKTEHIASNYEVFDFEISDEDMETLNNLG